MFRVEVERVLKTGDNDYTQQDSEPPLYMTLNTGAVTVGRKGCFINFTGDQSCSRNHCKLEVQRVAPSNATCIDAISQLHPPPPPVENAVLSLFSQHPTALTATQTATQSPASLPPAISPAYDQANVNADIVIVLTDLGSKFGTFVSDSMVSSCL